MKIFNLNSQNNQDMQEIITQSLEMGNNQWPPFTHSIL